MGMNSMSKLVRGAQQDLQEALCIAPSTQQPAATGAQQELREALCTAPAMLRLSHNNQGDHGAQQDLQEALCIAPAKQQPAATTGRRGAQQDLQEGCVLRLPRTAARAQQNFQEALQCIV